MESSLRQAGERYGEFVVTKVVSLPELHCELTELRHLPTGAAVMHLGNDDPENLFCLSFKTLPYSSNGIAHVLEHTVLCGSKKFPIKDPFFSMSRRSLNTFMNALTGSDFTCYPAASLNENDFYNLLDVYLDAVFHPELKRMSFLQEGHRLEFTDPEDPKTPLQFKGIVFNEMKGALASAETRLWHAMMKELVPDLPYAFNSGGDPKEIPNLSFAELISFHETYYHPSRCLFFFYGNFPLKNHLNFIAEKGLKNVTKAEPIPPFPLQKRFFTPVYQELTYPANEGTSLTQQTMIAFGFLTAPLVNQEDVVALTVLDAILMETDASLLKKELLQSNFCVQADGLIDTEMSEVPYIILCKGCDPHNFESLKKLIQQTLLKIIENGIPQDILAAAIHQLEIERLEITGDHCPFGLTLFMRSGLAKQHGCPPENALAVYALFETIVTKAKNPSYFSGLIRRYFLDNPHCVQLVMRPDPTLSSKEISEEKEYLRTIQQNLSQEETSKILKQAKELAQFQKQSEEQSVECLPKVTLADISPLAREIPLKTSEQNSLEIFHHECFTNHLFYAELIFDLPHIEEEDLPWVKFLTSLIPEVGCGNRSYLENLKQIQANTGGIFASCLLHPQICDPKSFRPAFHLRGKSLEKNKNGLLTLMRETLLSFRLDEEKRIEELFLQLKTSQVHQLNRKGMQYATSLALSSLSPSSYVHEAWHGLRYFQTIESIRDPLIATLPPLIERLHRLQTQLMTLHQPKLIITCSKTAFKELESEGFSGLTHLPTPSSFHPWKLHQPIPVIPSQARIIPSQVAFTAEAFKTVSYLHPHAPALTVASLLLDHKILHPDIREKGGAYGCGASYQSTTGQFYLYSYRDPHLASTLDTFHRAIDEISRGRFNTQDLEEGKLGIIQNLDAPLSPHTRGSIAYGWQREGKSKQMRQEFRDRLLSLTKGDIQKAVDCELRQQLDQKVIVTFSGKELLEKENQLLPLANRLKTFDLHHS